MAEPLSLEFMCRLTKSSAFIFEAKFALFCNVINSSVVLVQYAFTFEVLLYILLFPSFRFLLVQFCTFPSIKKCIIDPYYRDHPDEDLDKRRDLGIEVEEKKPEKAEDGEEEPENVFED